MEYQILGPWADVDESSKRGLQARLTSLDGKTIGLFAYFKEQGVIMLREIECQLKEKFPAAKFNLFQYTKELTVILNDLEYSESFKKWVQGVDAAIGVYGDGVHSSIYLAKNVATIEKMGKPAVVITNSKYFKTIQSGASIESVPGLRTVVTNIPLDMPKMVSFEHLSESLRPHVSASLDDIIQALIGPLTAEEKSPTYSTNKVTPGSGIIFKGDLEEVNNYLYKSGWTYGMPVMPPTEEAVKKMLEGTDLPPDHVVAKLPPRMGNATVEKIAINAVMAGCLPTYMPLLIAGVQAMVDPEVRIEGYSCSAASWFPAWIVNGPICKDLNINCGAALMSPYHKPNATIGHALGLITINIAGVRCGIEDNATIGHEGRFGVCFAENEDESPWELLHVYYGFNKEDSTITNIWPNSRQKIGRGFEGAMDTLRNICDKIESIVYDPGCLLIVDPVTAKNLSDAGLTRTNVLDYIVEYARRPQPAAHTRQNIDEHHINPNGPILTLDPTRSCRKFWSKDHIALVVAGLSGVTSYAGGGDHGGPIIKKVELPANWTKLVATYKDILPQYVRY